MNQIPNIEETHNTREGIERTEFVATLTNHALGMQSKFLEKKNWVEYIINSTLRNAEHEHHQQLQKARESCICKDKGVIELLEEQNKEAKSKIASLYLPAHEVSHGKDCIECKEIAAYNAAIQDAIKVIHSELDQDLAPIEIPVKGLRIDCKEHGANQIVIKDGAGWCPVCLDQDNK